MAYRLKNNHWILTHAGGELKLTDVVKDHVRPFYLYNLDDALSRAEGFLRSKFSPHYAMKANSCAPLLRALAVRGMGVDVVSLGEMQKAMACGFPAAQIIFSGVAKDREELEAALYHRLFQINVESFAELQLLAQICAEKKTFADVALRLNIHLTAPTHAHVQTTTPEAKFGIDQEQLSEVLAWLKPQPWIRVKSLATHIGSQIEDVSVFAQMAAKMGEHYRGLRGEGLPLERLDLGGGLGIDYRSRGENDDARLQDYLRALEGAHASDAQILIEPGRFLVARMGVLLARVIYLKKTTAQHFVILNAGMNFLMRPALYDSHHDIAAIAPSGQRERYTVVGPICESTDKFAVDRDMDRVERGDWVTIFDTGAYGAVMANTYNESPLPAQWSLRDGNWELS